MHELSKETQDVIQSLVLQLKLLESHYNDLVARESILSHILVESRAALSAVSALSEKEEAEIIVPIGGGLLLPVTYKPEKKVFVKLGAGVVIEKDREQVSSFLNKRIEEIEKALNGIIAQKGEIVEKMESLRSELERVSREMSKNV